MIPEARGQQNSPDNHTPYTQRVSGGLIRLVKEWPRDVTCTVAQKQDGIGDDLFGVSRGVGDLKRQDHDKGGVVGTGE